MQPAVDGKLPVAFEAQEAREIRRALAMAKELKLDPIITGALEAGETAAELKAPNARVIFSVITPCGRRHWRRTPTSRCGVPRSARTRRKRRPPWKPPASCSRSNRPRSRSPAIS